MRIIRRNMALSAALTTVLLGSLSPGAAYSVNAGGSLSSPPEPPPAQTGDDKADKRAKKAAEKAEKQAEEAREESQKTRETKQERQEAAPAAPAADNANDEPPPVRSEPAAAYSESPAQSATDQIILEVFGPDQGPTALRVARCESSMATGARNGSYAGLFQMGSNERSTYGHGPDARSQAEAAYGYFSRAGWAPWKSSRRCWSG